MLAALLAAASLSAPAAATAQAACPMPAPIAAAVRGVGADPRKYEAAAQQISELQKARRIAGASRQELACLDGVMGDMDMAVGGSAAFSYQRGIETLGGWIPPEQRNPPADPEDDPDRLSVTVGLAIERAGGLARLDDPVMDSLGERLVEAWIAEGQALEVDGLAQALLARRRARLGPDSAPAMASLASVVALEHMVNRWGAAVPASSDYVARLTRLRGPNKPETLAAGVRHAVILTGAGQEVEGARLARRLQSQAATALGETHPITFSARMAAAEAEVQQSRPPALAELEALAAESRAALGADHSIALDAETLVIAGLLRDGRYAEVEKRAETHYTRLAQARGQEDLSWVLVRGMGAEALLRQGRYNESGPIYSQVSASLTRLTEDHPLPLTARLGWGRSLMGPRTASPFDLGNAEFHFDKVQAGFGALGLMSQRDEALGWRGRARLRLDRPEAAFGDLKTASQAIWRRQSDRGRIATTEAAGELLRENRPLFMLTVEAGWRWAHQP